MNNWDELVDPMVLLKSFADHGPMAALLETGTHNLVDPVTREKTRKIAGDRLKMG